MLSLVWRKIKLISPLRKIITTVFFLKKIRKKIVGLGNIIQIDTQNNFPFISNTIFEIVGKNNFVSIGSGVRLQNCRIYVSGNNNTITIGNNVQGSFDLWISGNECQIHIGKFTTINKANIGAAETQTSVSIGEDCMLAHGIDIRNSDSHPVIDQSSKQRINYAQNIRIENHVWIGANVQILKGVIIGSNSVIASGSIVTKNIPADCMAAGIPAQTKRTGITWAR